MIPKSYLNKVCKILVKSDSKRLFYYGEVIEITSTHLSFIDKFGVYYTFKVSEILEINTQRE